MLAGANLTPDHKGRKLLRKLRWKLERQLCGRLNGASYSLALKVSRSATLPAQQAVPLCQ